MTGANLAGMRIANTNSRMKVDAHGLADRAADVSFKDAVLKIIGKEVAENWELLGNEVLVATYIQPRRTAGGILLPDKSVDEDRWQGKVGMVLRLGTNAFKYIDGGYEYPEPHPKVGDYVVYSASETREIGIKGVSCRFIAYTLIKAVVKNPDAVY